MQQHIEIQRQQRDEAIFVRQNAQLKIVVDWKAKYEEAMKWLKPALEREKLYCLEIAALKKALAQEQANSQKWLNRLNQTQAGEARNV